MHRKFLEEHHLPPLQTLTRRNKLPARCNRILYQSPGLTEDDENFQQQIIQVEENKNQELSWDEHLNYHSDEEVEEEEEVEMDLNDPALFVSDYSVLLYFSSHQQSQEANFDQDNDESDFREDNSDTQITITPIPEKRLSRHFSNLKLSTKNRNKTSELSRGGVGSNMSDTASHLQPSLIHCYSECCRHDKNSAAQTSLTITTTTDNDGTMAEESVASATDGWWEVEADISKIETNIYLGTYKGSLDRDLLQSNGITHIIQVVEVDHNPHTSDFDYWNVCVSDRVEEDLSLHFDTCSDYIHRVLSQNEEHRVFVHCGAGISRSAAMVIAYMMKYDDRFECQFRTAYEYLKTRRVQVKPNRGFKKQLELYQQLLSMEKTTRLMLKKEKSS